MGSKGFEQFIQSIPQYSRINGKNGLYFTFCKGIRDTRKKALHRESTFYVYARHEFNCILSTL